MCTELIICKFLTENYGADYSTSCHLRHRSMLQFYFMLDTPHRVGQSGYFFLTGQFYANHLLVTLYYYIGSSLIIYTECSESTLYRIHFLHTLVRKGKPFVIFITYLEIFSFIFQLIKLFPLLQT